MECGGHENELSDCLLQEHTWLKTPAVDPPPYSYWTLTSIGSLQPRTSAVGGLMQALFPVRYRNLLVGSFGLNTSHWPIQDFIGLSETLPAQTPSSPLSFIGIRPATQSKVHSCLLWLTFSVSFIGPSSSSSPVYLILCWSLLLRGPELTEKCSWPSHWVFCHWCLVWAITWPVSSSLPPNPQQHFSVEVWKSVRGVLPFPLRESLKQIDKDFYSANISPINSTAFLLKVPLLLHFFCHQLLRFLCPKLWIKIHKPSSVDYMLPSVSLLEVPTLCHSKSCITEGHLQRYWPVLFCRHGQI